ncbi:hypothetical protein NDU88_001301 [Pleurodeles waltl]|uniref:Uncharacterized protein n=1 Tax=Pleurodeles waltl TaxID=8319 RepID=A0AAV7Q9Q1_PLEWA|nr:hypothetical protein NDU88_001301 [Pleurodeles waltl]
MKGGNTIPFPTKAQMKAAQRQTIQELHHHAKVLSTHKWTILETEDRKSDQEQTETETDLEEDRPVERRSQDGSRDGSPESGPDPCLLQQYPVDAHRAAEGGADNVGTGSGSRQLLEPLTARPRCTALERRSGSRQIDSCKREACPEVERQSREAAYRAATDPPGTKLTRTGGEALGVSPPFPSSCGENSGHRPALGPPLPPQEKLSRLRRGRHSFGCLGPGGCISRNDRR